MRIVPIFQKEANLFVLKEHKHHRPVVGSIFQVGLAFEWAACDIKKREEIVIRELVGVAICGRPVGSKIDYKKVIDVTRLCVKRGDAEDNPVKIENGCSKLYAACARIAKEMGYESITTYTLESEKGTSLKASGWICEGPTGSKGKNHGSKNRHRSKVETNLFEEIVKYPDEETIRWRKVLQPNSGKSL